MRRLSSLGRLSMVVLPVFLLVSCSDTGRVSPARPSVVRISERDFRTVVTPKRIPAGEAELVVRNHGPDVHELIIVRSRRSRLPIRLDELTVDEEAVNEVGAVEGLPPNGVRRLLLHLAPGRYEVFCNMAGHFMAGMSGTLVVE